MPALRPFALLAALILAVLAPTVHASAAVEPAFGAQRTERIAAELVPMTQWATPGSTVVVAVRQDIQPGWHTYWRNPGDSGGATTLDWTLPAGVKADPFRPASPRTQKM